MECQAWKDLAQRLKMQMHQTVANRPRGNCLAERSNQSILQRLREHSIFGNKEWDVALLFAEIQFNNLTSNSLPLSRFEIDEGCTPHFPLDFPQMTSHANEPSTLNDNRLSVPSILCAPCSLTNVDAKCMWSCKWTYTFECPKRGSHDEC